jgi:hypothetical protein
MIAMTIKCPYAVPVPDRRMPEMNGLKFLGAPPRSKYKSIDQNLLTAMIEVEAMNCRA